MKTTIDSGELGKYVSPAEAARIVGISNQAMAKLVHGGYFTTRVVAGRVLVPRSEVEALGARPRGRPSREMQGIKRLLKKPPEITDRGIPEKYISQAEAARVRGVSKQAIANLIRRGRLATVSVAGRTLVIRSEVEAFVPQPVGHPLKKKPNTKRTKQKKSKK
jgi:predicted DNA-binding protein (UPF0251 family)